MYNKNTLREVSFIRGKHLAGVRIMYLTPYRCAWQRLGKNNTLMPPVPRAAVWGHEAG